MQIDKRLLMVKIGWLLLGLGLLVGCGGSEYAPPSAQQEPSAEQSYEPDAGAGDTNTGSESIGSELAAAELPATPRSSKGGSAESSETTQSATPQSPVRTENQRNDPASDNRLTLLTALFVCPLVAWFVSRKIKANSAAETNA